MLKKCSVDPEHIVIPLKPSKNKKEKRYCYFNSSLLSPCSSATVSDPFPYELAFAATIHKAQGRTIKKVVVDLTEHPDGTLKLSFASVLVALSRIKERMDIRLIHHASMSFESAYGCITKLQPHPDVTAFYKGFKGDWHKGQVWDPESALS